jgi:hypothetical protein
LRVDAAGIGPNDHRFGPRRGSDGLEPAFVGTGNRYARAFGLKGLSGRQADAAYAAGKEGCFLRRSSHRSFL